MKNCNGILCLIAASILLILMSVPVMGTEHHVDIGNFYFSPEKTTVAPGDTVTWTLVEGTHTTTSDAASPKAWDSGTMNSPGQTFSVVFEASDGPGPFPYLCTFHAATMIDTIFMQETCNAAGDINSDGEALTSEDFTVLNEFLNGEAPLPDSLFQADFNGDCVVNQDDLQLFEMYFSMGLSVFDPYGGYPVQTCCDPDFDVPPDTITIFGLEHVSTGIASLDSSGGQLILSNVGPTGLDGYDVDLSGMDVYHLQSVFPPDDSLPPGTTDSTRIHVDGEGVDETFGWDYIKVKNPDGTYTFTLQFNPDLADGASIRYELRLDGKKKGGDDSLLEERFSFKPERVEGKANGDPLDCDDSHEILKPEAAPMISSSWGGSMQVTVQGKEPVTADQIIIILENGSGEYTELKREARRGRNPQTGKEIKIPAKNVSNGINDPMEGFTHISSGLATFSPTSEGDSLIVKNIGSSGLDGFTSLLGRCKGGQIKWMAPEAITNRTYSSFYGDRPSGQDIYFGSINSEWFIDSGHIRVDFSPLGDTIYETKIYNSNNGENPLYESNHDAGSNVLYSSGDKGPGEEPFLGHIIKTAKASFSVQFGEVVEIDLNDGSGPHMGDRIEFLVQNNESDLEFLRRVRCLFAERDSIILTDVGAFVFGDDLLSGVGQAEISALGDSVTVGNIGSSGNDGLQVHWEEAPDGSCPECPQSVDFVWTQLDGPMLPVGASIACPARGKVGGVSDQPIGTGYAEKTDAGWQISADFSPIGATSQTIMLFANGSMIDSIPGHTGPAAIASLPPEDWHWENETHAKNPLINHPGGCTGTWKELVDITILGKKSGQVVSADAVKMVPENHTMDSEYFGSVEFLLSDIPQITFTNISTPPSYLCGDANSDSNVNVSDAVQIINYVFIGGAAPDPLAAGDANCDGNVNVSDAVWVINYVFIGGNAPCDTDGDDVPDC
jgi:plastocyanin